MQEEYLKLLKETFQDFKNFEPEKIRKLVDLTAELFQELQEKILSGDPKLQEEAEKEAAQIREVLEGQMGKLVESTGLSLEQLQAMSENPALFNETEQKTIENMRQKLQVKPQEEGKPLKKQKLRILG